MNISISVQAVQGSHPGRYDPELPAVRHSWSGGKPGYQRYGAALFAGRTRARHVPGEYKIATLTGAPAEHADHLVDVLSLPIKFYSIDMCFNLYE